MNLLNILRFFWGQKPLRLYSNLLSPLRLTFVEAIGPDPSITWCSAALSTPFAKLSSYRAKVNRWQINAVVLKKLCLVQLILHNWIQILINCLILRHAAHHEWHTVPGLRPFAFREAAPNQKAMVHLPIRSFAFQRLLHNRQGSTPTWGVRDHFGHPMWISITLVSHGLIVFVSPPMSSQYGRKW